MKKVAVRKRHRKGVKVRKSFQIRSQFWGRTTPKMKFLLKNLAFPEREEGVNFCKTCRKLAKKFYAASCSDFANKNFKSPKNRISAIFAEIYPPPPSPLGEPNFWEEISFSGSFDFGIGSEFGRNLELRHPFRGFFEQPLFWTFRSFFSPISLNFGSKLPDFLQKLQEFLQWDGRTTEQTDVPSSSLEELFLLDVADSRRSVSRQYATGGQSRWMGVDGH